jgi:hypothetical protein
MIFQCTELYLFKCNGSWILSIKYNVNFNFQPPAMFIHLDSRKSGLIKSGSDSIKICQHTKLYSLTLTGASFVSTSVVFKIPPSSYPKRPINKIIIQLELVDMSIIFQCAKRRLPKCNGSWVVAIKPNVKFKYQPLAMYVFLVFHENGPNKSCSPSEGLSKYKIPWSYVEWCKFCFYLRSSNVRNFGMVAATALKIMMSRSA